MILNNENIKLHNFMEVTKFNGLIMQDQKEHWRSDYFVFSTDFLS